MIITAVASLIIWPYSIKHLFFGYRGQGALDNLTKISQFVQNIGQYILKLNRFAFNGTLFFLVVLAVMIFIYKKLSTDKKLNKDKNVYLQIIIIPALAYFLIAAVASPWIELRYIAPICGLTFIIAIFYLYSLIKFFEKEKTRNIFMVFILASVLLAPICLRIEPETMFTDKKEIVSKLEGELNLPTIFFFNSSHNRFLDDILLFAKIDNSYIAKDMDMTEENIQKVFENKDISKGIIVFINGGQENDKVLEVAKNALGFATVEHLKGLNACNVYLLK